jgi:cell division protein FtsB
MTEDERNMDLTIAELEQENRLLRARNERLMAEIDSLEKQLREIAKIAKK